MKRNAHLLSDARGKYAVGIEYGSQPHLDRLYAMDVRYMFYCIRKEGMAFICICGYLFFEYVRPQSIYLWMDVVPWVPIFLACALLSLLLEKEHVSTSHSLNKLVIVYAVVVLISSLFSLYPSVSFQHIRDFSDWLIIYILIVKIVNNRTRFFIFYLSFLIYSLKMSQHGFISWAARGFAFTSWGVTGAPGWFQNSGEVGIQMALYVPLAMTFVFSLRSYWGKVWKMVFYFMPFSGVGTIVASSSRGALVGLAAAMLVGLKQVKYFFRIVVILSISAVVVWEAVPDASKARFATAGEDTTSLHRIERWKDGVATIQKYPVFGVGHGAWSKYFVTHFRPKIGGSTLVHNVFVQCGTELGLVGLGVFVGLIFAAFKANGRVRKLAKGSGDGFYYALSLGMDMALVGLIISSSFVTVLYYPYYWIYFALVASMENSLCVGRRV